MLPLLREKLLEVLKAVAPLIAVGCLLQFTVVQAPAALFLQFLAGSVLAVVGMLLLLTGIDIGILPMGQFIGAQLPKRGSLVLIIGVTFAFAFAITIAEPDVLVLSGQAEIVSHGIMSRRAVQLATALGLATFAAIAMVRIITGIPTRYVLAAAYSIVLALSWFAPPEFVPLAFDAGSVTTGVLSAPVMIALSIGLSSVLAGRSAVSDGFGILGLASAGPIIAILVMGMWLS